MKKSIIGIILLSLLILAALPLYASITTIKIDNVPVASDVEPEIKNNRTMVPLRVISENLGAVVDWSNDRVTLSKGYMEIVLTLNSKEVIKNNEIELLDVETYIKNKRTMVPLRFIAETFGAHVDYKDHVVAITTEPIGISEDMIIADLLDHPELIPYEAVLGGKMAFFKENTKVLSDRWVFAYFEDGHVYGNMLLSYKIQNGIITWEVIDSHME